MEGNLKYGSFDLQHFSENGRVFTITCGIYYPRPIDCTAVEYNKATINPVILTPIQIQMSALLFCCATVGGESKQKPVLESYDIVATFFMQVIYVVVSVNKVSRAVVLLLCYFRIAPCRLLSHILSLLRCNSFFSATMKNQYV